MFQDHQTPTILTLALIPTLHLHQEKTTDHPLPPAVGTERTTLHQTLRYCHFVSTIVASQMLSYLPMQFTHFALSINFYVNSFFSLMF